MEKKVQYITKRSKYSSDLILDIENIEWKAGKHLADRIRNNDLDDKDVVIIMTDSEKLVGFVAFTSRDTVANTDFGPFISTMYVSGDYRGMGISLELGQIALKIANEKNEKEVFILTQHIGLYEQLGFSQIGEMKDNFDRMMRILKIEL